MLHKKILFFVVLSVFSIPVFPQISEKDKAAELEKQAVDFLKETTIEINSFRTPENRISFNSELAALMWLHDEKQARTMFGNVITDFRQMLVQIDAQINALNIDGGENSYMPFMRTKNSKEKVLQKLRNAMSVRRQVAFSIAENDAILALEFFNETKIISNKKLRDQYLGQDAYFETQLLEKVAEQNPDKLADFARQSLKNGVSFGILGLLDKIYKKNDKEGAALGEEIFAKIKQMNGQNGQLYLYNSMLELGRRNSGDLSKTPVFNEQMMREAADLLGLELLKLDAKSFALGSHFLETVSARDKNKVKKIFENR